MKQNVMRKVRYIRGMRYQRKTANLVSVSVVDNLGLLKMLGDVMRKV